MSTQSANTGAGRGASLYRLDAWARPRVWVGDAVLAALVAAALGAFSVSLLLNSRAPSPWVAVFSVAVAVLHVALVGRRAWPRATFVVVALAELLLTLAPNLTVPASGGPTAYAPLLLPSSLVFLFALYAVAAYGRRPAPGVALGLALVGVVAATARLARPQDIAPGTMLTGPWQVGLALAALLAAVVAAFSLGLFRRMRADWVDALEERAQRAEADREERARLAAREERARIAREMHDLVAHSLAVIVRQADAGRYAARSNPIAAEQVLDTVAATGREALADMRSLIGVLRRGDDPDSAAGETGPQPSLADLPELLHRVRGSGLAVTLAEEGTPVPLDRAGELAGYRLVQEALTNVVKHAGPAATARVHLGWDDDGLTLTVTDTGGGSKPAGEAIRGGHGLVGMRERLRLAGGELVTGPRAGDGFVVRGRLPTRAGHRAGGEVT